jgi:hypothetical protein
MSAEARARKFSRSAVVQFSPWYRASSSTCLAPVIAASRRGNVVFSAAVDRRAPRRCLADI